MSLLLSLACVARGLATADDTDDPTPEDAASLERRLVEDIAPLLETYCFRCHGEQRAKADLRLDQLTTLEDAGRLSGRMEDAARLVSDGMMPAADPFPSDPEREVIIAWLNDYLSFAGSASGGADPGWFTIHRLNRAEYQNTMRDLLGIDPAEHDLTNRLPPDDSGYGFDNIADVLTMSPLQLEGYLEAAERALEIALGPPVAAPGLIRQRDALEMTGGGRALDRGGFMLYSAGAARGSFNVPITATYAIRVAAWGDRGGPELPRLSVRADGSELGAFFVEPQSAREATAHEVVAVLEAGDHEVSAHFTNDYYVRGVEDRNLAIVSIEVYGPLSAAALMRPPAHREIFFVEPDDGPSPDRDAAERIISRFASRAFRRPTSEEDASALLRVFDRGAADGGFERGVRDALAAILVAPRFLYRTVNNPYPDDPERRYRLDDFELASRLSYFLWSSMPDGELFRLAELGMLGDEDVLRVQVRRMLDDRKSDAFVENFAGQWLLLRNLDQHQADPDGLAEFDDAVRAFMKREASLYFADVLRSGASMLTFIDSDHSFLNDRLAALYDVPGVVGPSFRKVRMEPDSVRGGVLTMGAILTVTSNPTRTSPVKRGVFVLDHLLGTPPPPPPDGIPPLELTSKKLGEGATLREQLAAHVSDPSCRACHQHMDPIGLAMENFDAIGRWRERYDEGAIDATGVLPDGTAIDGPDGLKAALLAKQDLFVENLTRRILIYALGRGLESFDRPTVEGIVEEVRARGDRLDALIEAVVLSEAFRSCRGREAR